MDTAVFKEIRLLKPGPVKEKNYKLFWKDFSSEQL